MTNDATLGETKKGQSSSFSKSGLIKPSSGGNQGTNTNNLAQHMSSYQPYQGPNIVVTKK